MSTSLSKIFLPIHFRLAQAGKNLGFSVTNLLFLVLLFAFSVSVNAQIKFIENQNQWDSRILFRAEIPGGSMFIEKNSLTYNFLDQAILSKIHLDKTGDFIIKGHAVRIKFLNANPASYTEKFDADPEDYNFIIGPDPSRWASGIKSCRRIMIREIYEGIDLELLSQENRYLKYNFIVHPGADPSQIKMEYQGAENINLKQGRLLIGTSVNRIEEDAPLTYTLSAAKTTDVVKCHFQLKDNIVSFGFPGGFPHDRQLVIDPKVIFSTYSGSKSDNWGYTATFDKQGNAYSGGTVFGPQFPVTTGAYQVVYKGGFTDPGENEFARDCGILKYNPGGTQLLYCTYIGGSNNEQPHSMIVNNAGELCIYGTTYSGDFPVSLTAFDKTNNGQSDIFIFKLSADGKTMIASTFVGGSGRDGLNGSGNNTIPLGYNYGDEFRGEIVNDVADNIYIASCTESSDFPLKNSFRGSLGGLQDGCVLKINSSLSTLSWSSYLGGSGYDAAYGIAVDELSNIFVCGGTNSTNMSLGGTGMTRSYMGGKADGFLVKINASGNSLDHGTYLGTAVYDQAYLVQIDKHGDPYVTGQTADGLTYPVSQNIYANKGSGQFITKYANNLGQILRSTVFGTGRSLPDISPCAFLVDKCERVFFTGWGGGTNQPPRGNGGSTAGLPVTGDAFQLTTDGSDFYMAIFSKNLDDLLYGTFFGGVNLKPLQGEHVDGGTSRFDKEGIVYQTVCGGCGGESNFPTTPGAWSRTNGSENCNAVCFKVDFENLNRDPQVDGNGKNAFYSVIATDILDFGYSVSDPEKDSLFLQTSGKIFGGGGFNPPFANMPDAEGMVKLTTNFHWTPGCQHISTDTLYIDVSIRDIGCPASKSVKDVIRVLVKPPPLSKPPRLICLKNIDNNSLSVSWDSESTDKYFSYYLFYKRFPDGTEKILDTVYRNDSAMFTDLAALSHTAINYCYYLVAVNICGQRGDSSYRVCSVDEFLKPISPTYLIHATVPDNRNISLKWVASLENDFDTYEVFRRVEKAHSGIFEHFKTINGISDTGYTDTAVNVQANSYCYYIIVKDGCNHVSPPSNRGCTILLNGSSVPFEHHLNWSPYSIWQGGVGNYDIQREPVTQSFSVIGSTDSLSLNYVDDKLDYDYGLYAYRVVANEGPGSFGAQSQSNEIVLIQPPLLHVPSAFTPNGDQLNEFWGIMPVFVKDYTIKVFNRWGQQIFESHNKKEQWNGGYRDNEAFDNVFIYLITYSGYDGSVFYRYGDVTILR